MKQYCGWVWLKFARTTYLIQL